MAFVAARVVAVDFLAVVVFVAVALPVDVAADFFAGALFLVAFFVAFFADLPVAPELPEAGPSVAARDAHDFAVVRVAARGAGAAGAAAAGASAVEADDDS